MKDDTNPPDALRRDVAADLLRAVQAESHIPAFRLFGASRVKKMIREVSKAMLRPTAKHDGQLFSIAKAQALTGYATELAMLTAGAICEMKAAHVVQTKLLLARIEQLETVLEELRSAREVE